MLVVGALLVLGQHSVAHNDSVVDALHAKNPFFARTVPDDVGAIGIDATKKRGGTSHDNDEAQCADKRLNLRLAWETKLGASVYATPLLVRARSGGVSVWANTIVRYAEALDGHGHEVPGWPYAFTQSGFHTSPLAYDVDGDGVDEMLLLSFDAEIIFLTQHGLPLRGRGFRLPKLRVRKDWFEGLHDIHTTPFKRDSHKLAHVVVSDDDDNKVDGGASDGDGGTHAGDASFGGDIGAHGGLSEDDKIDELRCTLPTMSAAQLRDLLRRASCDTSRAREMATRPNKSGGTISV